MLLPGVTTLIIASGGIYIRTSTSWSARANLDTSDVGCDGNPFDISKNEGTFVKSITATPCPPVLKSQQLEGYM